MRNGLLTADRLRILTVLMLLFVSAVLAQTDRRIEDVRKLNAEANKKIAECETDGAVSTTFLTELVVNKNNASYPAVGIYRTSVKFYYTFGNREKNQYPDRLLKILVTTNRSAMTEISEYLFDSAGTLIFYFEKKDNREIRLYFLNEKLISAINGEKILKSTDRKAVESTKIALREKRKLVGMFQSSLEF